MWGPRPFLVNFVRVGVVISTFSQRYLEIGVFKVNFMQHQLDISFEFFCITF